MPIPSGPPANPTPTSALSTATFFIVLTYQPLSLGSQVDILNLESWILGWVLDLGLSLESWILREKKRKRKIERDNASSLYIENLESYLSLERKREMFFIVAGVTLLPASSSPSVPLSSATQKNDPFAAGDCCGYVGSLRQWTKNMWRGLVLEKSEASVETYVVKQRKKKPLLKRVVGWDMRWRKEKKKRPPCQLC